MSRALPRISRRKPRKLPRKQRLVETLKFRRAFKKEFFLLENPLRMRRKHPERQLSKKGSSGLVARRCVPLHGITPCCFRGCFRQIRGKAVRPVRVDAAITRPRNVKKVRVGTVQCEVGVSSFAADFHGNSYGNCTEPRPRALIQAAARIPKNSFFWKAAQDASETSRAAVVKKGSSGLVAESCRSATRKHSVLFRGCFREIRGKAVRPVRANAAIPGHTKPNKTFRASAT